MSINLTTLPNGLRIITDTASSVETLAIGVWAGVGTRHEPMERNGIAHMLEHMMFKGTKTRTAKDISDLIENAGGHFNAYTGKEITAYHITILNDHLDLTIDVLGDLLQNSTFPEDEIIRERAVITQEIKMYEDSPDDMVFENAFKHAFPDQSLGASGLGTPERINAIGQTELNDYVRTHYTPDRIVISAAGDIDHESFVRKVGKSFSALPQKNENLEGFVKANYSPTPSLIRKDTEQAHLILGFEGVSRLDPRYPAQRLLSNILGGGTSSRLWQEIREKRGLVYDIHTFHDAFQDGGLLGIYAGTGPDELEQLTPIALDQILGVTKSIGDEELSRAKTRISSAVRMGREKMMNRADQQGRYLLCHDEPFNISSFVDKINAVSKEEVLDLANEIFSTPLLVSAYGPIGKLMPVEDMKQRLNG